MESIKPCKECNARNSNGKDIESYLSKVTPWKHGCSIIKAKSKFIKIMTCNVPSNNKNHNKG